MEKFHFFLEKTLDKGKKICYPYKEVILLKDKNVCRFIPESAPSELTTHQFIFESNAISQAKELTLPYHRMYLVSRGEGTFRFGTEALPVSVGDMIFAFDNWRDREIIEKHLKIWKKHCPSKTTKFYLFCGFELTSNDDAKLLQDIKEIFWRIRILMSYGCLGYVMRHEDYKKHDLANIYVQIARWCNQPQL